MDPDVKVVLLGLPKTGTTSFHEAFKSLNKLSEHYNIEITNQIINNYDDGMPIFSKLYSEYYCQIDYAHYDMICHPQSEFLESIKSQYPNAKFILNLRDVDAWYSSLYKTIDSCKLFDRYMSHISTYYPFKKFYDINPDPEFVFKSWFTEHNNIVIDLFKGCDNFLVFNIEKDDIHILQNFLGEPQMILGHFNKHVDP
jgi:hypothetical protein